MATSYVHPVARFQMSRMKFRPKLAVASKTTRRDVDQGRSADRTTGVGISTTSIEEGGALPPRALVQEAIDTALDSVGILERQARDVARRFRRHAALAEANLGLSYLVQSTQTLLRLADMTATASGRSLEELCDEHRITAPADTNAAVSSLIREQLAEDWSAVATVLEQRFLSALAGWRTVFEALGGTTPDPYGSAA
jgi:hypothetical protein